MTRPTDTIIPEPALRSLISSLEGDAQMLTDLAADLKPQILAEERYGDWSRLHLLIGRLQGYAEGLRMHLPHAPHP